MLSLLQFLSISISSGKCSYLCLPSNSYRYKDCIPKSFWTTLRQHETVVFRFFFSLVCLSFVVVSVEPAMVGLDHALSLTTHFFFRPSSSVSLLHAAAVAALLSSIDRSLELNCGCGRSAGSQSVSSRRSVGRFGCQR